MELVQRFCQLQLQLDSVKQLLAQKESLIKGDQAKIDHLEKVLVQLKIDDGQGSLKVQTLQNQLTQKDLEVANAKIVCTDSEITKMLGKLDNFMMKLESRLGINSNIDDRIQLQTQVESMQRQLIDLKQEQLLEIEEIRANSQVELLEEKKKL